MMGPLVVIRTFEGVGQSEDGCLEQEKNNTKKKLLKQNKFSTVDYDFHL